MTSADYGRIIAKNLRRIAYENGKTQADMCRDLRISQATISSWMTGVRVPRMSKIDLLCHYFNCTRSDLMEEHTDGGPVEVIKVPIYGRVAAGIPIDMIEDITDEEEIPKEMGRGGKVYFGLRIKGDSMEPKMSDGDHIIVLRQDDAESGDIVVASVNGNDATCKVLKKYDDGIALISTNPAYPPYYFSRKDVESIPVRILGRVVELRAKF